MTGSVADLRRHLEATYGVKVRGMTPLEPWAPDGVQRVDLDHGASWVARTHGAARPAAEVHGDADILRFLADHDFPAGRLAHAEPVSTYDSVIRSRDGLSAIDWTGSCRGPRVQSLGTLAWVGHPALIDAFVAGYREHAALEPEELDRLDGALVAHGLILQAWGVAFRGAMSTAVLRWLAVERKATERVVARAREAFEAPL